MTGDRPRPVIVQRDRRPERRALAALSDGIFAVAMTLLLRDVVRALRERLWRIIVAQLRYASGARSFRHS
jgi:uncharacterized membrane protein